MNDFVARNRLRARLDAAVLALPTPPSTPTMVVDLDAFDANAADLARRAGGTPLRVATKSLRVPALVARALAADGFSGAMGYSLREALWLHEQGLCSDIVLGYPTVDRAALERLVSSPSAAAAITLMVDCVEHLDVVDSVRSSKAVAIRVAIDLDAGLRMGGQHVGPKRSPLYDVPDILRLARTVVDRRGFALVGVMTYEGQVAGVPDNVPTQKAKSTAGAPAQVRLGRAAEGTPPRDRRRPGRRRRRWSSGTPAAPARWSPRPPTPSSPRSRPAPACWCRASSTTTRPSQPRPAAYFGVPVLRRPTPTMVTVAGGGFVASGPHGADRMPQPWAPPALHLTGLEGAGEVQTPLTGPAAATLRVGDTVWFRHAKSGELFEHANDVHLLAGDAIVETVPTYRGTGHSFG